jgi:streptomycin 6-kinase
VDHPRQRRSCHYSGLHPGYLTISRVHRCNRRGSALEIARIVRAEAPPRNSVIFLLSDGGAPCAAYGETNMTLIIPERLAATCRATSERRAWLEQLPDAIRELQDRWSLSLGTPFDGEEVSCAWVAPAVRSDGSGAVLKLGMPHMEAEHEIQALRFWNGDPTVRLLEADETRNAMLLERCEPGTVLRQLPEPEQDVVIAGLLRRLWRRPSAPHPFPPLAAMTAHWANETLADSARWPDAGLVQAGLRLFEELPRTSTDDVLLATDLHAGNVLRAQREPWLVIDPKSFVGDCAYDATQHLFNCEGRMRADPEGTIRRFADLLEVDYERVRLWMFARAAAESRDSWDDDSIALARVLA